ncbi:MAG: divalent metal cation transporter FieF [Methylophaga sp.]|nr:MAG: divalent metal cation transporter FieF [Methylophaga sp.]
MRLATYASVSTAMVLIFAKLVAWFMSDSVSVLATLLDSSLDVVASVINLFAVRHALQPADHEHRFGHGKAEALAGMAQAFFIAGSAGFLLLQASGRLFHPQAEIASLEIGVGVMIFSIIATLLLLSFQKYVISKTHSTAIKADALHYKTDLWVNASVIVALVLTFYGWPYFDALFAVGIAIFILYSAWGIIRESIDLLMDHELPDAERKKIKDRVMTHGDVLGLHDLRTRRSGNTIFIQLHLELDGALSLSVAHAVAERVEQDLISLFPSAEVIIHEDPVDSENN